VRVLHLTTEFPPVIYGGLGTAVGGLAYASAEAGMQVGVLVVGGSRLTAYGECIRERTVLGRSSGARGVALFQTPWDEAWDNTLRVVAWWRPDLIHLHVFWLWDIARRLREATGVPIVYTVHSLDLAEYELGNGPPDCLAQWNVQQAVLAGADLIVAPSRSEMELVAGYCPAVADRVIVAGHGVDDLPSRAERGGSDTEGGATVLFVGRFVDRKGIRELLDAIPTILKRAPFARFVLVGGNRGVTPEEMESWWLPPQLGFFRDRIRLAGWLSQEETEQCYDASEILVVPSWYEPFGMVVLEGMLHGMAIAASSVGGPGEILEHERTGLLFPPRDPDALAAALTRLLQDSVLRRRLAQAAAEEVRRRWLWPEVIGRVRVAYAQAVSA
jgi:glycogen(starch) synthase